MRVDLHLVSLILVCLFILVPFALLPVCVLICIISHPKHPTQDVDFSRSHLCGYLRIRGLTEDWPELTTYFDAEIIGSRYGFLTRNWGASEQEDWVHWARFPAFRHVKNELEKPHLTMKEADRGAVFMRWKEKFLVPDHRVQDINGASFAGESIWFWCVLFFVCFTALHTLIAGCRRWNKT